MSILKVNKIQDTTGDDALTFDSSGNTTVNQTLTTAAVTVGGTSNLTISDGNLVIGTGGHGIDFSAQTATSETGATTTSELLDHYEEGTFTPVVKIGGSTTGITTESTPNGKYTRIGRLIHFACMVILTDKGSNTGALTFENLPFACSDMLAGTSNDGGGIVWFQGGMNSLTTDGRLAMRFNSNQIEMKYLNSDNNTVNVTGNDLTDNSSWRMQGTYYV
tara:strand:- start:730 stop:1386 length:657 start_codon:yes stop_codon:yes gene_type:complete